MIEQLAADGGFHRMAHPQGKLAHPIGQAGRNQGSHTAKIKIRINPSQNAGMVTPNNATSMARWSKIVFFAAAEMIPMDTPSTKESTMAVSPRERL